MKNVKYAWGAIVFSCACLLVTSLAHAESAKDLMALYDEQSAATSMEIPADKPHLNQAQIAEWVEEQVTNAMTIDPVSFDDKKKNLLSDFQPYALTEYETHVVGTGLVDQLKQQSLKMNAIQDGAPQLVSEGALEGTYRWLYDVPLMLSYYPSGLQTLKTKQQASLPNQKITIRVQLGRLAQQDPKHPNGVMMEHWTMLGAATAQAAAVPPVTTQTNAPTPNVP